MATKILNSIAAPSWSVTTLPVSQPWTAVAYGNGKFVGVAFYGPTNFAYSTDGIKWIQSNNLPTTSGSWSSVTYGNNKFVTVAGGSVGSNISLYSTDGITWIQANPLPYVANWRSVTYGNGKFVAISSGGNVAAYSTDGITWTQSSLPTSNTQDWSSVTFGNGKFVAVCSSNSTTVAYSTDGVTWSSATMPSSQYWNAITYGNDKYVVICNGSNHTAYSADGINWTQGTISSSTNWNAIAYGNGLFIATDNLVYAYSYDGITWYQSLFPSSTATGWRGITFANNTFISIGYSSSTAVYLKYYNTNNIKALNTQIGTTYQPQSLNSWTAQNPPPTSGRYGWSGVSFLNDKFVTTISGQLSAAWSSNGINWNMMSFPASSFSAFAYGKNVYCGLSYGELKSIYSFDGINWVVNTIPSSTTSYWTNVAYGNNIFVSVGTASGGANNTAYSTNGVNWTFANNAPYIRHWQKVAFGIPNGTSGRFVAISNETATNNFMYSNDGITWYGSNTFTAAGVSWTDVIFGYDSTNRGVFVAVTSNTSGTPAQSLYSYDGITWTSGTISNHFWQALTYTSNGIFIAVGAPGSTNPTPTYAYSYDGVTFRDGSFPSSGDNSQPHHIASGNGTVVTVPNYGTSNKFVYATLTVSNTIKILST